MSAVELLPCPFCGGEPTFIKIGNVHTKMAVTVRCPKCRVERTDATPKAFNHSDHGWLLATAGKNWNRRPTIAPPVAAGSVATAEFLELLGRYADTENPAEVIYHIDAWGAQQHYAGVEAGRKEYADSFLYWRQRAEKAEAELKQVKEWRNAALQENMRMSDLWMDRVTRSEARVKELERESGHKQSIIDRLMLEYCPNEMTAEQIAEWASHQKRAE